MSRYALLLKDPGALPLSPASFLASGGEHTPASAQAFLRENPGFVARGTELEKARDLSARASAAGLPTMIVPETDLPSPPPALVPDRIAPGEGGFRAFSPGGSIFVQFESIRLIHPSVYEDAAPPRSLDPMKAELAGEIRGIPPSPPAAEKKETFFRADILTSEGLRLLLKPENLDFSPLGADISLSSMDNFRSLLDLIAAPCFNAVKGPLLPVLAARGPAAPFRTAGPDACELGLSRMMLLLPGEGTAG